MAFVLSSIQLIFREFKIESQEPFPVQVPELPIQIKMISLSKNLNSTKCQ